MAWCGIIYKKTTRTDTSENAVTEAVNDILRNKTPIRYAALRFGIKKSTLYDRLKKKRSNGDYLSDSGNEINSEPERYSKYGSRQVFSVQEENQLEEYLKVSSNINYGLTFRSCSNFGI
ncbi:hypothetical protein NQ314_018714 [Rhamnusium bicolor]|uniref:HTH psq-type domain-containing protein n=1 Tax=Rhamnusium bicolor TaxID=1586634 RepID=A0AAV8WPN2_9CUCU|nr:hypothetical protein NQ314_018714 [Rhamnusium bicolor]